MGWSVGRNVRGSPVGLTEADPAQRCSAWCPEERLSFCSSDDCVPGAGNPGMLTPGTWRVTKESRYY